MHASEMIQYGSLKRGPEAPCNGLSKVNCSSSSSTRPVGLESRLWPGRRREAG
jgi:hypothetical protein